MWLFKRSIPDGSPWIDYKEATKTLHDHVFVFRIEQFIYFILREVCVTYPCAINGRSQLQMAVTVQAIGSQNKFSPVPIDPQLFSSPSQNFRQGALDEEQQGGRLQPIVFNYPCDRGDNIIVTVSGVPTGIVVGCMLTGRKYEGEPWL